MIYDKNKNSLEKSFLGMAFLGKKIPWKNFSLEWRSLEKKFLGKIFPCCGIPWKKNSLECRTATSHPSLWAKTTIFWPKIFLFQIVKFLQKMAKINK
jgi:hypothetical protein